MRVTITIDMANAAFDARESPFELAHTLERLTSRIRREEPTAPTEWPLHDVNGNRVGKIIIRK